MKRPKHHRTFAILLGSLPAAAPMTAALADNECDDIMSDQGIVELVVGADINDINTQYGTTTLASIEIDVADPVDGVRLYLLQLPAYWDEDDFEDWFDDDNDPRIVEADLNYQGETAEGGQTESFYFYVPPTEYVAQYSWDLIGLETAHQSATGNGVIVALLDTGAEADHEALVGHILLEDGYNFVDGNTDTSDVGNREDEMVGHGTFMAGIVAMVAPDAGLLIVKVLDGNGQSDGQFRVAQGIYYAVQHGADVINLSLAMSCDHEVLRAALEYAEQSGVVVVAAAGNLDDSEVMFPADDSDTIGVASTDINDFKAVFSNFGDDVSISAPGTDIVSSFPGHEYVQWQGTSMSVALVSGAAALVKANNPSASPEQIEQTLQDAAVNIDDINGDYEELLGEGRLFIPDALIPGENPADLNQDGSVNATDLLILLSSWGSCGDCANCPADLNDDCAVGAADLIVLLGNWG
ncbi:MAG: S8 family serine peptidase [Phycisphaerales bacterium]